MKGAKELLLYVARFRADYRTKHLKIFTVFGQHQKHFGAFAFPMIERGILFEKISTKIKQKTIESVRQNIKNEYK